MTALFTPRWDEACSERLGVAQLTQMAFRGQDLRPLWHEMMDKATDDTAGAGLGMDLSVIAQLLGDQPTGLALQTEVAGAAPAVPLALRQDTGPAAGAGLRRRDGYRRQYTAGIFAAGFGHRTGHLLCGARHAAAVAHAGP